MATNSTTYYNLPVFAATDQPKWLVDWNTSMEIIDGAIAQAKAAGDNAQTTANANAVAISGLSESVSTMSTALGTLTTNVTTLTGNMQRINELIGNGTPTTTDKTIIGAINELKAEIDALAPGGAVSAAEVSYDNTSSGLTADDVQEAIDEVNADLVALTAKVGFPTRLDNGTPQYSADGGTTWVNFSGALSITEVESAEDSVNTTLSYTFENDHSAILIECNVNQFIAGAVPMPTIAATSSDITLTLYHDRTQLWAGGGNDITVDSKTYHAENVKAGDTITFTCTLTAAASSAHLMDYAIFAIN